MQENRLKNILTSKAALAGIFLLGILARLLFLSRYPVGLNQDEAFAGYLSYSLANYGMDNFGYGNPVYFTAWGSGMNALYSYLTIPLIRVLGLTTLAIRLPQAIFSILSLGALYGLLKRTLNQETAVLGLFLLAISPWHIVMSRWGLEAAIAPAFVLFGLYFFTLGLEKKPWLLVSALMYGLSLYCYATVWLVVPFVVLFQLILGFRSRQLKIDPWLLGFVVILGVMAVPLLLFLAINMGLMGEVRTQWISIPRMAYYRGGEFSLAAIPQNILNFFRMFFTQNDGMIWNAVPGFGYYYLFSWPFIIIGFVRAVKMSVAGWKEKKFYAVSALLFQFALIMLESMLMSDCEMNKINTLHISVIVFCAMGIWQSAKVIRENLTAAVLAVYALAFVMFAFTYTHSYEEQISVEFDEGALEAIQLVREKTDGKICLYCEIDYSIALFASRLPAQEAAETTVYNNYPAKFLEVASFGNMEFHKFLRDNYLESFDGFVWPKGEAETLKDYGFTVVPYGNYVAAYK